MQTHGRLQTPPPHPQPHPTICIKLPRNTWNQLITADRYIYGQTDRLTETVQAGRCACSYCKHGITHKLPTRSCHSYIRRFMHTHTRILVYVCLATCLSTHLSTYSVVCACTYVHTYCLYILLYIHTNTL